MFVNPTIFRAYDIRGVYPDELNEQSAGLIAAAFAKWLKPKKVVLGQDARPSSDVLKAAVLQSLAGGGAEVIDIGWATSPMFYFAVNHLKADGGIMVTASHIPLPYNGLKLVREKAISVGSETGLKEIQDLLIKNPLVKSGRGRAANSYDVSSEHISSEYIEFLLKHAKGVTAKGVTVTPLLGERVVIDALNGMAGPVAARLCEKLGLDYVLLNGQPDFVKPKHIADPAKSETLKELQAVVKKHRALFGAAFDGDGDRIGFVDEKGQIVRGDLITALLAQTILKQNPGGKVIYDLVSSRAVPEAVVQSRGVPIKMKVGHGFIKAAMRLEDAIFAGELTGHYYYRFKFGKEYSYFESGLFTLLKVLELLSRGQKLSQLIKPLQRYYHSGVINVKADIPQELLERIEKKYSREVVSRLDGIELEGKEWRAVIRPSNTEPLVRLMVEAKTRKTMQQHLSQLLEFFPS